MRIAYVLPTRNRPDVLDRTLSALAALPRHDAQVVVADNASDVPSKVPVVLDNGLPVTLLLRDSNEGAAARNAGAAAADASCEWIVMLDDDSHPLDLGFLDALRGAPREVLAVAAEIFLPGPSEPRPSGSGPRPAHDAEDGSVGLGRPLVDTRGSDRREAGGLPEVFIGCGVAFRREAFLAAGGYDPTFGFYAEEYDLAAKLMLAGGRITFDRRFRVLHEKTLAGRNMDLILRRLVRNNAWVMQRYAPASVRRHEVRHVISRYGRIAIKERAEVGYLRGLGELAFALPRQPRTPLSPALWDRFTGKAACRRALLRVFGDGPFATAALVGDGRAVPAVGEGKNAHIIREVLSEMGVSILPASRASSADAQIIGTLSPGPMLDAADALRTARLILPWDTSSSAASRSIRHAA